MAYIGSLREDGVLEGRVLGGLCRLWAYICSGADHGVRTLGQFPIASGALGSGEGMQAERRTKDGG